MHIINIVIGVVDMDGFTGRTRHPEKTDAGRWAQVMSIELFDGDEDGVWQIFEVLIAGTKRRVQLMAHEIAHMEVKDGTPVLHVR